jgi:O-antigen ligase
MNGLDRRFGHIARFDYTRSFFLILVGTFLGLLVLAIFKLPSKFIYYMLGGPVLLFIAILTGRFKRFFQGALIFIIPINLAHNFFKRPMEFGGGGGIAVSPLDITLVVLYAIWIYEIFIKKSGTVNFFPRITIPALGLLGLCLLNMISCPDPYLALFEAFSILKSIMLFLYIANHIQSKRDVSFFLVFLLVGLFLQSIFAFAQRWLGIPLGLHIFGEYKELGTFTLDYYLRTSRVGGTIGHANGLAKYVELLAPICVALLFTGIKLKYKMASSLIFICAFIVLLLTLSRGGWVCFMGSMMLILLLIFRAKLISLQTLVAIVAVAIIFAGVMLSFSGLITSRLFGGDYGSAESRIPAAKIAVSIIRAHPLLGVGVRHYNSAARLYNPILREMRVKIVHNAYLQMAAEMGIPALLVFLWLIGAVFRQGLRNLKSRDIFLMSVSIGLLAGLSALWAHWLVDHAWIGRESLMWVLIGLTAAVGKITQEIRSRPPEGILIRSS